MDKEANKSTIWWVPGRPAVYWALREGRIHKTTVRKLMRPIQPICVHATCRQDGIRSWARARARARAGAGAAERCVNTFIPIDILFSKFTKEETREEITTHTLVKALLFHLSFECSRLHLLQSHVFFPFFHLSMVLFAILQLSIDMRRFLLLTNINRYFMSWYE